MKKSVNRGKRDLFKKRHFTAIIRNTAAFCTHFFAYKKPPLLFESQNHEGDLMVIFRGYKGRYGIFYDYLQFKRVFGHLNYEAQAAYATSLIAHEMRHYYQMRQLDSKKPREPKEVLDKWRYDDEHPKYPGDGCSILEFYMQPMELDAQLFAYLFVAYNMDAAIGLDYIDESYIGELEKYYISIFGDSDVSIFHPTDEG